MGPSGIAVRPFLTLQPNYDATGVGMWGCSQQSALKVGCSQDGASRSLYGMTMGMTGDRPLIRTYTQSIPSAWTSPRLALDQPTARHGTALLLYPQELPNLMRAKLAAAACSCVREWVVGGVGG